MTAAKTSGRHLAVEEGHRRSELAAIHTGAKALGLDDSLYRDLLERVTGARSAAGLDGERRRAVLDEMRRLGFEKTAGKRAGRARLADSAQARLIRALWLSCATSACCAIRASTLSADSPNGFPASASCPGWTRLTPQSSSARCKVGAIASPQNAGVRHERCREIAGEPSSSDRPFTGLLGCARDA